MQISSLERAYTAQLFIALLIVIFFASSCVTRQYPIQEKYYENEYITENRSETYSTIEPVTMITSGEEILTPYIMWSNPSLLFGEHKHIWYYGYNLSNLPVHNIEKIRIMFSAQQYYQITTVRLFDMSPRGQILAMPLISSSDAIPPANVGRAWITMQGDTTTIGNWLNLANVKLNFARFIGGKSDLWLNKEGPLALELDTRGARELAIIISGPSVPQNTRFGASLIWSDNMTEYVTRTTNRNSPIQIENRVEKLRTIIQSKQVPFWEIFIK